MRQIATTAVCGVILALASGCTQNQEAKAKQEARELSHKIDRAVNTPGASGSGSAQSAEEKLRRGTAELRSAGEKAEVRLDRAALVATAKTKLASTMGLSTATSIQVEATGQTITLRGTVATESAKQQAEQIVSQMDGVTKVVNRLTVAP